MSSLLKEILDRIEFEQLISEGKDPVEVLKYKFQQVPSNVIDKVISIDPTKKKSFSQWLLSKWDDEKETILSNLNNGRIEKLFQHYKKHNDIQIKDCPSVAEGLAKFVPEEDTVLTKSTKPTTRLMNNGWVQEVDSNLANDFDIIFNEDNWIIAVPHTYEADCKLGENMYWCTAGGRTDFKEGRSYYNHYLETNGGEYYVNFDMSQGESRLGKDYPFTRYQFHFESEQFMDKEDDPVTLDEINIPESAVDFYESKGYDMSELDDWEVRYERYSERRWNDAYQLTDDLYLNTEFDDDLQYTEPTPATYFYLFDDDDNRDPIIYDAFQNPHTNPDVVVNIDIDNEQVILQRGSEYVIAMKKQRSRYYARWYAYTVEKYLPINGMGFFIASTNGRYALLTNTVEDEEDNVNAKNCESITINKQCTQADQGMWNRYFVETIQDGYHSLFAIDISSAMGDSMDCLIRQDIPVNGSYFEVNEKGLVEGQFKSYRIYNDDDYEPDENYQNIQMVKKIDNDTYEVSRTVQSEGYEPKEEHNIYKNGQILLNDWFDSFIKYVNGIYIVKKKQNLIAFYNEQGQQLGTDYNLYGVIDEVQGFVAGKIENKDEVSLISAKDNGVIATFFKILSSKSVNNKISVVTTDNTQATTSIKFYDYIQKQYCFEELQNVKRISSYHQAYLCTTPQSQGMYNIFDFNAQKITATNIKDIGVLDSYEGIYKLFKPNNKQNVYSIKQQREIIPVDVDKVEGETSRAIKYQLNGKYFVYDANANELLINKNGFNIEPYILDYGSISFAENNVQIMFRLNILHNSKLNEIAKWVINKNGHYDTGRGIYTDSNPYVINLYNKIVEPQDQINTSQNNQQQQTNTTDNTPAYAVTEQFNKILKKIDKPRNNIIP